MSARRAAGAKLEDVLKPLGLEEQRAALQFELSYGQLGDSGWHVMHSTLPGRAGEMLPFAQRSRVTSNAAHKPGSRLVHKHELHVPSLARLRLVCKPADLVSRLGKQTHWTLTPVMCFGAGQQLLGSEVTGPSLRQLAASKGKLKAGASASSEGWTLSDWSEEIPKQPVQ